MDSEISALTHPMIEADGQEQTRKLCSRPHGNLALFSPLLATLSFIIGNAATDWCDFVYRNVDGINQNVTGWERADTEIGIWSYRSLEEDNNNCYWYPDDFHVDSYMKSARAFANLSAGFGGCAMIILLVSACIPVSKKVWRLSGVFLLIACLYQGLVFLFLKSDVCHQTSDGRDVNCELSRGSRCCVAAVVFWFITSITILKYDPPKNPEIVVERVMETVTTVEEVRPDGTKVTNTTTTYVHV